LVNKFNTDSTNPITDSTNLNFSYSSLYLNLKAIIMKSLQIQDMLDLTPNSNILVAFIQYGDIDATQDNL